MEGSNVYQAAKSHSSLRSSEASLCPCLAELQALEKDLVPKDWKLFDGPKRKAALQSMTWPLKEIDTRRRLQNLERLRGTLTLALNVEQR